MTVLLNSVFWVVPVGKANIPYKINGLEVVLPEPIFYFSHGKRSVDDLKDLYFSGENPLLLDDGAFVQLFCFYARTLVLLMHDTDVLNCLISLKNDWKFKQLSKCLFLDARFIFADIQKVFEFLDFEKLRELCAQEQGNDSRFEKLVSFLKVFEAFKKLMPKFLILNSRLELKFQNSTMLQVLEHGWRLAFEEITKYFVVLQSEGINLSDSCAAMMNGAFVRASCVYARSILFLLDDPIFWKDYIELVLVDDNFLEIADFFEKNSVLKVKYTDLLAFVSTERFQNMFILLTRDNPDVLDLVSNIFSSFRELLRKFEDLMNQPQIILMRDKISLYLGEEAYLKKFTNLTAAACKEVTGMSHNHIHFLMDSDDSFREKMEKKPFLLDKIYKEA